MRRFPLSLCVSLVFSLPAIPQSTIHPRPPGLAEGQKQIDKPLEPPMEVRNRQINIEQVKQEAEELRKLADGVPAQIQQAIPNTAPQSASIASQSKSTDVLTQSISPRATLSGRI